MTPAKRSLTIGIAVVALAAMGAVGLWRARQDATPAGAADAQRVAPPPIAARLSVIYPEAGGPAVVTVRLFNHAARQAAATNTALDAAASKAPREAVNAIELALAPDAWAAAVRFVGADDGTAVPASDVRVIARPDASRHVLGAEEAVHARFEIAASGIAALGGGVSAVVSAGEWRVTSNTAAFIAPADPREQRIQRARAAEAAGDAAALAAAGEALVQADAADPWGYWYRGLAREAQGDRAGALEAYHAAASRLSPAAGAQEPPVDLFRRIAALR